MSEEIEVHGHAEPRFERVRQAFGRNFSRGEVGAAVAVSLGGELVVDLWGGSADAARTRPWERDTLANVYSTTKGMTALCANRLIEAGTLDPDAPVARYWPEFAQAGKEAIPVRMLLSHRAGLAATREPFSSQQLYDWSFVCTTLAEQAPLWEPGTRHGYHALTFGHLAGELVRRVDGRSLGSYFREELSDPLGLDFHIGLPDALHSRCAEMVPAPPPPPGTPSFLDAMAKQPDSLAARVFGSSELGANRVNTPGWRRAEIPAANGHGTARGLARVYGALAGDGTLDGVHVLGPEQRARAATVEASGVDAVLAPLQTRFGLGYMITGPMIPFGPNPGSFGHPGMGGSIAFADPDTGLGFGYVMNQMQLGLAGDARGFALIQEVYASLA
jgi:CubicO group peptidase (beta-lactamase class C family)